MGKINEYQRQQLASSVVGVASENKSGQIIAQGVESIGSVIQKGELERRDARTSLQANLSLTEFGIALQSTQQSLRHEMASNPDGYQEKLLQKSQELVNTYAGGIADQGVRSKFMAGANNFVKAQVISEGAWVAQKNEENLNIAAKESVRMALIVSGQTTSLEQLNLNLASLKDEILSDVPEDVQKRLDIDKYIRENSPAMIESHLANRVMTDPESVLNELNEGKYNDVPFITSDIIQTYKKSAESAIKKVEQENTKSRENVYYSLLEKSNVNELSLAEIQEFETTDDPAYRITPRQAFSLRKGVIDRVESDASKIAKNNLDAAVYVDLVRTVFNRGVDRAKALDMMVDVFKDGIVTGEEKRFLTQARADLETAKGQLVSNKQAIAVANISRFFDSTRGKAVVDVATGVVKFLTGAQGEAVKDVATGIDRFSSGAEDESIEEAAALRSLITKMSSGVIPEEAESQVLHDIQMSRSKDAGIDVNNVPKEGRFFKDVVTDKVYRLTPEGSYEEVVE